MAEVKKERTTERLSNAEAQRNYESIKAGGNGITGEECWKTRNTYEHLETVACERKVDCEEFYNQNFEQVTLFPDGNGGSVSANGQIIQPAQPVGYNLHPRKLMKFIRDHSSMHSVGNDIIISIEPGYEYLLDILAVSLQLDHQKISSQHASGTLHSDLKPYIMDAPIQLQIGVAHVKKGGNS
jgi:hypothetical protein